MHKCAADSLRLVSTADRLPRSGCISGFRDIIRRLQGDLRDEFFHFPQGNTDSEWAFACFLEQLARVSRVGEGKQS
jgi:hypothetical protein